MRDPLVLAEVKRTLALLKNKAPGHSVEVRVPPYAAVQCIEGPRHRRGTPPAVIELQAQTWLDLAKGQTTWAQAVSDGLVAVSGERADLAPYLPVDPQG